MAGATWWQQSTVVTDIWSAESSLDLARQESLQELWKMR